MDRREMLTESVRSLSRYLPRFFGLGILDGVDHMLKVQDEMLSPKTPGCFPEGPAREPDGDTGNMNTATAEP